MEKNLAPALSNGLNIIEIIAAQKSLSFNQLAEHTGYNASSLNRYLKVLIEYGYIHKTKDLKYILGLKTLAFDKKNTLWSVVKEQCRSILENINEKFNVTGILIGLTSAKIYALDKVTSPYNISMQNPGSELGANRFSPWGVLLMAGLSSKELNQYKKTYKHDLSAIDERQLDSFIEFAKENGYSDDNGMLVKNVRRLAVPVYSTEGEIIAAVGCGSFAALLDDDQIIDLINMIKEGIKELLIHD